jgi:hypothetical protein
MPRAQRTEVDDVPVLWNDFGEELSLGTIVFRVGAADETLQTHGLTHLVEHIALSIGDQRFFYNGFVDDTRAVFTAQGSPEQLKEFLEAVTRNLTSPQLDSIALHARVLRTEAAGTESGWLPTMKNVRFGARSYGLSNYSELGLHWVGPDEVLDWSRSRFTARNAVAWMTCPPPDGLRFFLDPGNRIPPPEPQPRNLPLPVHLPWETQGIALAMLAEFSRAMLAGLRVLERAVMIELRHQRGMSYSVGLLAQTLTANIMHVGFSADCLKETALQVRDAMLSIMQRLATRGPTDEEMVWLVQYAEDLVRTAATDPSWLDLESTEELFGVEFHPAEELADLYRSLTRKEVAEALTSAFETAVMLAPHELGPAPGFRHLRAPLRRTLAGKRFQVSKSADQSVRGSELTVGKDGVSVRDPNGSVSTALFGDCVGVGWVPDGRRVLLDLDGTNLLVDPSRWMRGPEAVAMIDATVSQELFVPLEGSAPGPRLPSQADTSPRDSSKRRWWTHRQG